MLNFDQRKQIVDNIGNKSGSASSSESRLLVESIKALNTSIKELNATLKVAKQGGLDGSSSNSGSGKQTTRQKMAANMLSGINAANAFAQQVGGAAVRANNPAEKQLGYQWYDRVNADINPFDWINTGKESYRNANYQKRGEIAEVGRNAQLDNIKGDRVGAIKNQITNERQQFIQQLDAANVGREKYGKEMLSFNSYASAKQSYQIQSVNTGIRGNIDTNNTNAAMGFATSQQEQLTLSTGLQLRQIQRQKDLNKITQGEYESGLVAIEASKQAALQNFKPVSVRTADEVSMGSGGNRSEAELMKIAQTAVDIKSLLERTVNNTSSTDKELSAKWGLTEG